MIGGRGRNNFTVRSGSINRRLTTCAQVNEVFCEDTHHHRLYKPGFAPGFFCSGDRV